jgi:hypothetical protein
MNTPSPQPQGLTLPRLVVCAALRHPSSRRIIAGARHFDEVMRDAAHPADTLHVWEQGFLDQRGVFLSREDAWTVAEAAGQIRRRVGGDGVELFSENLY